LEKERRYFGHITSSRQRESRGYAKTPNKLPPVMKIPVQNAYNKEGRKQIAVGQGWFVQPRRNKTHKCT
jgi:hypothetical protein